jgi:integrase
MKRIGARRVLDFWGTPQPTFNQMTLERPVLAKGDLVIFTLDLSGDRNVTSFGFLRGARRQHLRSDHFQCFALFRSRFLVDVIVGKIPVSERFHHGLSLRTLTDVGDGKAIESNFSIIAFLNEEHLAAATGHFCGFGIEPAWAGCITGTGFLELAGNFPWSFVLWFIRGSKRRPNEDESCNECAGEEGCAFHRTKCISTCVSGQCDFDVGLPAVTAGGSTESAFAQGYGRRSSLCSPLRSKRRLERVTRLELATSSLARRCSTTELHPQITYEKPSPNRSPKYRLHTDLLHCRLDRVRTLQSKIGVFQKVGECLYRYSSNGVYYGRIRVDRKEIKRSLKTTDRDLAKRKLADLKQQQGQIDRSQGKITLAELCDRYLQTVQHQKPKTIERKTLIVRRIKSDWPTGSSTQVGKINKPSDVQLWLARFKLGPVSRNHHLALLKKILQSAVDDGVIVTSPASGIKPVKLSKPIRKTPTFEQFKAIVESIRSQEFNGHDAEESADFVEFIGLAGLGQAETAALEWPDIDWQRDQIITFRHKTKSGFAIPLYPQLRPLLERRHSQRTPGVDQVFAIKNAKKAITAACKRLGLPAYSHRSFRRMFITRAIEKGVKVPMVAEWQGHKDGGKLILSTYSHVWPEESQRMAKLMTDEQPENVVPMVIGGAA